VHDDDDDDDVEEMGWSGGDNRGAKMIQNDSAFVPVEGRMLPRVPVPLPAGAT
jgi:hypothetical protein